MRVFSPKWVMHSVNSGLHLVTFVLVIMLGDYRLADLMLITVCLVVAWAVGHVALIKAGTKRSNGLGYLTLGIILIFWVAYTSKFGTAMLIADEFKVVPTLLSKDSLLAMLPGAFFVATVGYAALLIAVLSFPMQHRIDWRLTTCSPRYGLILALVILGLIVKYILKAQFLLAVPGLEPVKLFIPYLSGILGFFLGFGYLFFVNIPFFLGLLSRRRWYLAIAFFGTLVNALIDLKFGSKDTIMYQLVVIVSYLFILKHGLPVQSKGFRHTFRVMLIVLAILSVSIIGAYKYMNYYRFAMLSGSSDIATAVQVAAHNEDAQSLSSLMGLYNRVTGVDVLSSVMVYAPALSNSVSLSAMFDGTLIRRFTDLLTGGADSKNAAGLSFFGYWYVYAGVASVFGAMLLIGFLFAFIQYVVVVAMPVPHNMRLAFLPVLWIMFVFLMMGGNPTVWLKQVILCLAGYFIFGRIALRRRKKERPIYAIGQLSE